MKLTLGGNRLLDAAALDRDISIFTYIFTLPAVEVDITPSISNQARPFEEYKIFIDYLLSD